MSTDGPGGPGRDDGGDTAFVPRNDLVSAHRNDERWRCVDCGTDWPCAVFQRRLRSLYAENPDRLRTFMRHFRDRAAADLGDLSPTQLDARFVGWVDESRSHPRLHRRSI